MTELIFAHGKSKAHLATHKDVSGQLVYGWSLELQMITLLVMTSLRMAQQTLQHLLGEVGMAGILIHQDRGSQYTSYAYVDAVVHLGGRISYSDAGTPTHNPGQESFHGRLKEEWADEIYERETLEELRHCIADKLNDYNLERIHTSIGNQSPWRFTKLFLKNPHCRFPIFRG